MSFGGEIMFRGREKKENLEKKAEAGQIQGK
jgi:hypothetical protein